MAIKRLAEIPRGQQLIWARGGFLRAKSITTSPRVERERKTAAAAGPEAHDGGARQEAHDCAGGKRSCTPAASPCPSSSAAPARRLHPTEGPASRMCSARPRRMEIGEDHGKIEDGGGRQGQGLQHPELNMRLFHKILEVSCRFLNCDCVASIHVYKLQLKKLELGHAAIPKIIEARI